MDNIFGFVKAKIVIKRTVYKRYEYKNIGILIKQNSKIICLCNMLRACTLPVRCNSLLAGYAHACKGARLQTCM